MTALTRRDVVVDLKADGFDGFRTVAELNRDKTCIPREAGVYLVLRFGDPNPSFLKIGSGGYFKGENPNVDLAKLKAKWVDGEAIVYIGKAGGRDSKAELRKRLGQYLSFGSGKPVGHRGGCYIWQLADAADLVFCWKPTPDREPAVVKSEMIETFRQRVGRWPFANRKG